jgi:hypothetical protein
VNFVVYVRAGDEYALRREDEIALDQAVCVRNSLGGTITACVTGDDTTARAALARGADKAIYATSLPQEGFCVCATTYPVPADVPCVPSVTRLATGTDGTLWAIREHGDKRETLTIPPGVLVQIAEGEHLPRLVPLREILRAESKPVEGKGTPVERVPLPPPPVRTCRFVESVAALRDALRDVLPPLPQIPLQSLPEGVTRLSLETIARRRPSLERASVIVAGGRALGDGEVFDRLVGRLADHLGAAVAASGGATSMGYADPNLLVGQSGLCVTPAVYLALGISGVDQHIGGIMRAKTVIAVNRDKDAPLFAHADIGYIGDLFTVVPELIG